MTLELATLSEVMTLGDVLAKSGFFQDARGAAQAVVKVLAGRELGFGPIASMTGVHIVKGKPSLSANMQAAAIRRSGKYDYDVIEHTAKICRLEFSRKKPDGTWVKAGESSFSIDDAKTAELGGDNWRHYPKNMLFARAMSNGAKWYTPDVFGGPTYTPDELGIDVDGETGEVRNLKSVSVEEAPEPPRPPIEDQQLITQSDALFPLPLEAEEREKLTARIKKHPESKVAVVQHRLGLGDGEWKNLDLAALAMLVAHLDKKK